METTQENEEGKQIMEDNKEVKPITKDTTFAEVMQEHPEAREELFSMGLGCGGCPMAQMESIEGGAHAHGINPDALLDELNTRLVDKKTDTEQTTKQDVEKQKNE